MLGLAQPRLAASFGEVLSGARTAGTALRLTD
jgi:hypothetical protein